MGRFNRQKGLDILLEAWAIAALEAPDWRLEMIGNGPLEAELRAAIADRGLRNVAILPPTNDVPGALSRAAIFALPSRWEGLPMVLLEAVLVVMALVATTLTMAAEHLA